MNGINLETKQFDFLSKDFKAPKNTICRIEINGKRYYYEIVNGYPIIYASGTTLISDGYPDPSPALEEWKVKMRVMGNDPTAFMNYRADYGTIMHMMYGDFLQNKQIPLGNLESYILGLNAKISPERMRELVENNIEEFLRDLLSFATWVKDFNVKPLAIEMMIASRKYMVATAIDLICNLTIEEKGYFGEVYKTGVNKGKPKETKKEREVLAIVDFKSGKKGFYDKHALQLLLNSVMMEENYPELKVERIFNFSPKEWKSTPSYNFKDQSQNPVLNELSDILNIGRKRHAKKSKKVKIFKGNLSLNTLDDFNHANHYETVDIEDYIITNIKKKPNHIQDIVDTNDIVDKDGFNKFIKKLSAKDLKELANKIGIKYNTKKDFINKLNLKYEQVNG